MPTYRTLALSGSEVGIFLKVRSARRYIFTLRDSKMLRHLLQPRLKNLRREPLES